MAVVEMEKYVQQLISECGLPADADIYLDSIKWQEEQAGKSPSEIEKDLKCAASIASFYSDPITALKKLDKAFPEHVRMWRFPKYRALGLENLRRADYAIIQKVKRRLNLNGLGDRIEQHLFGIDDKKATPAMVRRSGRSDEPNPSFENAVKRLES